MATDDNIIQAELLKQKIKERNKPRTDTGSGASLVIGDVAGSVYDGAKGAKNAQNIESIKQDIAQSDSELKDVLKGAPAELDSFKEVFNAFNQKADLVDGKVPSSQLPNDIGFSGSYNDLTDKPEIYSQVEVDNKIASAVTGGTVDLSNYPTLDKVQELDSTLEANLTNKITEKVSAEDLSSVATSGSYNDLTDKPDIPTVPDVSGFATKKEVSTKIEDIVGSAPEALDTLKEIADKLGEDEDAVSALTSTVSKKSDKAYVDGELAKKANSDDIPDISQKADLVGGKVPTNQLPDNIGFSGSYKDLTDKPEIYSQVEVDNKIASAVTGGTVDLSNYPTLDKVQELDSTLEINLTNKITAKVSADDLSTVATSGSYNDLTDKPDIPAVPDVSGFATKDEVSTKIEDIVGSAPEALDTLKEIADKLGEDEDAVSALTSTVGKKSDKTYVDGELAKKAGLLDGKLLSAQLPAISKDYVGLGNVPNYSATSLLTDGSANKFATAKAIKELNDNLNEVSTTIINRKIDTALKSVAYIPFSSRNEDYYTLSKGIATANISTENIQSSKAELSSLLIPSLEGINIGSSWGEKSSLKDSLAKVATSGNYNDLSNKPTIPSEPDLSGYAIEKEVVHKADNLCWDGTENNIHKSIFSLGNAQATSDGLVPIMIKIDFKTAVNTGESIGFNNDKAVVLFVDTQVPVFINNKLFILSANKGTSTEGGSVCLNTLDGETIEIQPCTIITALYGRIEWKN